MGLLERSTGFRRCFFVFLLVLDEVYPSFGPGPISPLGPGPAYVPSSALSGIVGGPGPRHKKGPRPKTPLTSSKTFKVLNDYLQRNLFIKGRFRVVPLLYTIRPVRGRLTVEERESFVIILFFLLIMSILVWHNN